MQLAQFMRDSRFDTEWQEVFAACQEAEDPAVGESGFAPHSALEGTDADTATASDDKLVATVAITNDEELQLTPFPVADCIVETICADDFGAPAAESAIVAYGPSPNVDEPAPHAVAQATPLEAASPPSAEHVSSSLVSIEIENSERKIGFLDWARHMPIASRIYERPRADAVWASRRF